MLNTNRKYICKKSIRTFRKGKSYNINMIFPSAVEMINIINNQYNYYVFSLYEDYDEEYYFYDYFYSDKDERKMKLEKLKRRWYQI